MAFSLLSVTLSNTELSMVKTVLVLAETCALNIVLILVLSLIPQELV